MNGKMFKKLREKMERDKRLDKEIAEMIADMKNWTGEDAKKLENMLEPELAEKLRKK